MSAKSIVQEVFGKMMGGKTAKAIVQDALGQAGLAHEEEHQEQGDKGHEEPQPKFQTVQQGDQKVITFSFTLDPQMVEELGKAMPKGAKPEDRGDVLNPEDGGDSSRQQSSGEAVATEATGEQKDDAGNTTPEEKPADDKGSEDDQNGQKPNETVSESPKEDGSDDNQGDDDGEESRDGSVDDDDPQATPTAQDEAIACDGRHTDTPIENCRAEDPMFCPYHGAQRMTSLLQDAIANQVKQHNLTPQQSQAIKSSVVKESSGSFKLSVVYPTTVPPAVEKSIQDGIGDFLQTKGLQNAEVPATAPGQGGQPTTESTFNTQSLRDRMPQGSTDDDYKAARAKQSLGIMNEWMDDLIEDFGDPNSEIDPTDLENLMNMQAELEDLVNQSSQGNAQATAQFEANSKPFEELYHVVRGNADLADTIKTPQDAQKMYDDLKASRQKAGDLGESMNEVYDIRNQLGWQKGRVGPKRLAKSNPQAWQALGKNWDRITLRSGNMYKHGGVVQNISDSAKAFGNALTAGDMKAMRGALHNLEWASEQYESDMKAFNEIFKDHKNDLLTYAQQNGITITPHTPKPPAQQQQQAQTAPGATGASQTSSSSTPSVQTIQAALNGVPTGVVSTVIKNQNGEHFIEFTSGNANYAQSLIPSLQQKYPNNTITFVSGSTTNNGKDYIKIV